MGGSFYSFDSRTERSFSKGYTTKDAGDLFEQIKKRKIHESMDPKNIRLRESRDSTVHPATFPIIFGMDVTGSMKQIPHELLKDGLPKMISGIIQRGVTSPALLFLALGDSQVDDAPFQVGQFESGDAEMDLWLTRTWPEGGGGSNDGESYLWAWYFAAHHCVTDAWEKRNQKGLLITFGDEPCLKMISASEMTSVMGIESGAHTAEDLLADAQDKWEVYHIHFKGHRPTPQHWKDWLGQNLIEIKDHHEIPAIVARLAEKHCSYCSGAEPTDVPPTSSGSDDVSGMSITL